MRAGKYFKYFSVFEWMKNAIVCCFLGKNILVSNGKKKINVTKNK